MSRTGTEIVKTCLSFFKKHLVVFVFLGIAICCWLLQFKYQRWILHMVPANTTFYKLIAYFFFLLIPYLLLLQKKKYILANIVIIGPILIAIEFTCFALLEFPDKPILKFELPDVAQDNLKIILGDAPEPNDTIHDHREGVFNVDYITDQYARRITPGFDSSRSSYALFFGCSIAFGYGLNDNETMAYYYQELANCNSKNYGYNGYGSNQVLARFQHENLSEQIPENRGVAFYLFFWDHIKRTIGTMRRHNEWLANAPYYFLDNEQLKRAGTFRTGRPWTSWFYELAYQCSITQYFQVDVPFQTNDYHYDLVSEIILEIKKEYTNQFGNDEFYLVFYPTWKEYVDEDFQKFKTYLDKKEITYFDLNTFMEYKTENSLGEDPHPNAATNKVLAEELYKRYKSIKKK